MKKRYELDQEHLHELIEEFLKDFPSGVVLLQGDLAAGKTTLVQAFAKYFGIEDEVTSPTFSLQHVYAKNIYHYDMYNKGLEHFLSLGMLEELEKEGLHFVEWGTYELQEILQNAGIDVATISIEKISFEKRSYTVCIH
jgi:tRNA threonylcarbamoyladenosine biosynthesis protein TsaE